MKAAPAAATEAAAEAVAAEAAAAAAATASDKGNTDEQRRPRRAGAGPFFALRLCPCRPRGETRMKPERERTSESETDS